MLEQAPRMLGVDDRTDHGLEADGHPAVAKAARKGRSVRMGASGDLYHSLLPTILEQRITIGEAHHQWRQLCFNLSEPAPGPFTRLLLPPEPSVLARQPSWWFHPLGIERNRAEPLLRVAKHAAKFWEWAALTPSETRAKLHLIDGVGQWTIGNVLGPAVGDPDAVAVGDYHLKNMVGTVLAGEARATDERMLELLEPYVGQRGRVVRLLRFNGGAAPKFGPKQRILPMHTW
jgi:3-methyladenine DNA glycosylase/8-oxoguanine DNA glycosylase|tara:strand:+ start:3191 stop:3886 length:696 start_codon:yes stop_codon:yes gene_type:complete